MDVSFTADGDWFVFDTRSGKTLERGFKTKGLAIAWIATQRRAAPIAA